MLYAISCVDGDQVDDRREQHLSAHKDYLVRNKDKLVLGGALVDTNDRPFGSLYVVNVPDRAAADAFSKGDPFTEHGVFGKVTISAMRKSHWNPGSA